MRLAVPLRPAPQVPRGGEGASIFFFFWFFFGGKGGVESGLNRLISVGPRLVWSHAGMLGAGGAAALSFGERRDSSRGRVGVSVNLGAALGPSESLRSGTRPSRTSPQRSRFSRTCHSKGDQTGQGKGQG